MREVSIEELKQLAEEAKENIWIQAETYERSPKLYLHWTAGHYDQTSDHYNICITGDGAICLMKPLDVATQGTWKRNSGAINIAICGCFDAGSQNLGSEPPTAIQIEKMAQVIAVLATALGIEVTKQFVLTHGEAANNEDGDSTCHAPYAWWNDGYGDGDTRGDLEYLGTEESPCYNPYATDGSRGGDVLRGKAIWYQAQFE